MSDLSLYEGLNGRELGIVEPARKWSVRRSVQTALTDVPRQPMARGLSVRHAVSAPSH